MKNTTVLEKTIQTMEKELAAVKNLQSKKLGAESLKGCLKGANITKKDIEEAKKQFNTVEMP